MEYKEQHDIRAAKVLFHLFLNHRHHLSEEILYYSSSTVLFFAPPRQQDFFPLLATFIHKN